MTAMYNDSEVKTIKDIKEILKTSNKVEIQAVFTVQERAKWIRDRLVRFKYRKHKKKEKRVIREYLCFITGCKKRAIKYHITAYLKGKKIGKKYKRNHFSQKYSNADKELLAYTDNLHSRLNGVSTKVICKAMYEGGDHQYKNLSEISVAHLYNLRKTNIYKNISTTVAKTKSVQRDIGTRKKPFPNGKPGYIRVDTVHQGDKDAEKGVYHINLVDEVTQWDIMVAVEGISEEFLIEAIEGAIEDFPFKIIAFHSDNGSEYINRKVEAMLNKMLIEQTKSRAYISNDNGLVESKNGSIIRKHMGHHHIKRKFAPRINKFYKQYFIPYINYYRPCAFPEKIQLEGGKVKAVYPQENYKTPLKKLLSIENIENFLKPEITPKSLLKTQNLQTPNQSAEIMQREKKKLLDIAISLSN